MESSLKDDFIPENFHINSVYIYMHRSPAPLGRIPDYSLQIFNGGDVVYSGNYNVKCEGKHFGKIKNEYVFDILKMAVESNYFGMRRFLGMNDVLNMNPDGNIEHKFFWPYTDMGATTLEIRIESKSKIVTHWGGIEPLSELEEYIDLVCSSDQWTGEMREYKGGKD